MMNTIPAKKVKMTKPQMVARMYFKKHKAMRPDYFDEERGCWVSPSWADIPEVIRARTRYYKWLGVYKKKK